MELTLLGTKRLQRSRKDNSFESKAANCAMLDSNPFKKENRMNIKRLFVVLLVFFSLMPSGVSHASSNSFGVFLWPDGSIPYKFDTGSNDGTYYTLPFSARDKGRVGQQMAKWVKALTVRDPSGLSTRKYIRFWECGTQDTPNCPTSYVLVRYNKIRVSDNKPYEKNNMCTYFVRQNDRWIEKVGRNPTGKTEYHLTQSWNATTGTYGDTQQPNRIILHELGHCLGIWHEFNRSDADRWLQESPDFDGSDFSTAFITRAALMPNVGNYDYDSILSYGSYAPLPSKEHRMVDEFLDHVEDGNVIDKTVQGAVISKRDISRVLQYYAHERYPGWGFFRSLSPASQQNPDALPNPYLAGGLEPVEAIGTPTIAFQSPGNYDIFARGSNGCIYWKMFRIVNNVPISGFWRSIGCEFSSDPSAVSRSLNRIDVVAINNNGEVQRIKYIDGNWYSPLTIRGGYPTGGIKQSTDGGYIGPAIASRGADSLDVFVVRSDGRLAVTTWSAGNWGQWRTLGTGYSVTARPAAVALSATRVQFAINESDANLYEPSATFSPALPSFHLGILRGTTAPQTPPALTKRNEQRSPYRVLITNADGRISHRFASSGAWIDIGGIPKPGTGPSAVATGDFTFIAIMNGEDATGCDLSCSIDPEHPAPHPGGAYIRPGGLWIRYFD
jgi:hypothetical protein